MKQKSVEFVVEQENPPHKVYRVNKYDNFWNVCSWINELEDEDCSIFLGTNLYHFRTRIERKLFVIGMDIGYNEGYTIGKIVGACY